MKSKETKMDNNDSFSYETKKEKKKHSPSQFVLPLLAATSGAVDGEWEREVWEIAGECKYTQQSTKKIQWLMCINFPQKLIES